MAVAGRRAAPCKATPNKDPNKILIYCYLSPERERGGEGKRERAHCGQRLGGNTIECVYIAYIYIYLRICVYILFSLLCANCVLYCLLNCERQNKREM